MAYYITDPKAGYQPIASTSTTIGPHSLGTVVRAVDSTYGAGEFIYLLGVANTEVGSLVRFNATTYQTTLCAASDKNTGVPFAVAMSANVASQYGWYQICGNAVIKKTGVAVTPGVAVYLSATSGRIKVLASAGQQIVGAKSANLTTVVTTTSTVVVTIDRPCAQSQIT